MSLADLPLEILIQIFTFVNLGDRKNIAGVNKRFYELCDDSSYWMGICKQYFPYLLENQSDLDLKTRILAEITYYRLLSDNNVKERSKPYALSIPWNRCYWSCKDVSPPLFSGIPLYLKLAALKGDLGFIESYFNQQADNNEQANSRKRTALTVLAAANGHLDVEKMSADILILVWHAAVANNHTTIVKKLSGLKEKDFDIQIFMSAIRDNPAPNIEIVKLLLQAMDQYALDKVAHIYAISLDAAVQKGFFNIAEIIIDYLISIRKQNRETFDKCVDVFAIAHTTSRLCASPGVLSKYLSLFSNFKHKYFEYKPNLNSALKYMQQNEAVQFFQTCRNIMEGVAFVKLLEHLNLTPEAIDIFLLQGKNVALTFTPIQLSNQRTSNNNSPAAKKQRR